MVRSFKKYLDACYVDKAKNDLMAKTPVLNESDNMYKMLDEAKCFWLQPIKKDQKFIFYC